MATSQPFTSGNSYSNSYLLNQQCLQEINFKQPLLSLNEFNHNLNNNISFRSYMGSNGDDDVNLNLNDFYSSSRSDSCGPAMRSSSLQRTFTYNSKYS